MVVVVMEGGTLYSTDLAHTRWLVSVSQINKKYSEASLPLPIAPILKSFSFFLFKVRSIGRLYSVHFPHFFYGKGGQLVLHPLKCFHAEVIYSI